MKSTVCAIAAGGLALVCMLPAYGQSSALSHQSAVEVAAVEIHEGVVSGVLINHAPRTVRDVRLLVRENWYWTRERRPGAPSPGRSDFVDIDASIPPGGRAPFSFEIAPRPPRPDGHFETEVEVAAYTEVGR